MGTADYLFTVPLETQFFHNNLARLICFCI